MLPTPTPCLPRLGTEVYAGTHAGRPSELLPAVPRRSRQLCRDSITEALPVGLIVATQLRDASGADAVLASQDGGPLIASHVLDYAAVTLRACPQPGGKVAAESNLVRHRRLPVVVESLFQDIALSLATHAGIQLLVGGPDREPQGLKAESLMPLGGRAENVSVFQLASHAAAALDGAGSVAGQRRDEVACVLAATSQGHEPLPAQAHHLGDAVVPPLAAADAAEEETRVLHQTRLH